MKVTQPSSKKYDVPHFARFTHISGDFLLESVDGLELDFPQLVEVGGDLVIRFNSELPDLRSFKSLLNVGGDIIVTHNDSLKSLVHLKSVVRVGGNIVVHDNPVLNPQHPEKLMAIIRKHGSCEGNSLGLHQLKLKYQFALGADSNLLYPRHLTTGEKIL